MFEVTQGVVLVVVLSNHFAFVPSSSFPGNDLCPPQLSEIYARLRKPHEDRLHCHDAPKRELEEHWLPL